MDGDYTGAEHTYIYQTLIESQGNSIEHVKKYKLSDSICKEIKASEDPFGDDAYRKSVFFDNYSRLTYHDFSEDGSRYSCEARKEDWSDLVIRVIEGLMTHYLDMLEKKNLPIDMSYINDYAEKLCLSMFKMEWLPPGRGLFAMGTSHAYRTGSTSLNNCYATSTKDNFILAMTWSMSMLLQGGGVGCDLTWRGEVLAPNKEDFYTFVVPDSREGWACCVEILLRSYIPINGVITNKFPKFDYSLVRPYGAPIKGFGGTASGSPPLRILLDSTELYLDAFLEYQQLEITRSNINQKGHEQVNFYLRLFNKMLEKNVYKQEDIEDVRNNIRQHALTHYLPMNHSQLIMNVFNLIGKCVYSGNVRRSAEIVLGDPDDLSFMDMKNWMFYPTRREFMHNSNNTLRIWNSEDREKYLSMIVERVTEAGEPGACFVDNIQKYGRMGETIYGRDEATLLNPCGEVNMMPYEPCCLGVICPMLCLDENEKIDEEKVIKASEYATFYATTVVGCVPHEWKVTNEVVKKNRRIGVSVCGVADIYESFGKNYTCEILDKMYKNIRNVNEELCKNWGINRSIRVSSIKPEGSIGIICGLSPGCHFSIMRQGCRRIGVDNNSEVLKLARKAGYKIEKSTLSENSSYIMFPLKLTKAGRCRSEVSMEEQTELAIICQKYYADNAVSYTLGFKNDEIPRLKNLMVKVSNELKCISAFPELDTTNCQYKHLPFQPLGDEEYEELRKNITKVDWTSILYPDKEDCIDLSKEVVSGCTGEFCERPIKK